MKRYSHLATNAIFTALADSGISQRWLARRLRERLGEDSGIWESRLSDWKSGRREMPDDAIEAAFDLLPGLTPATLSFFAVVSPSSDTQSLSSVTVGVPA